MKNCTLKERRWWEGSTLTMAISTMARPRLVGCSRNAVCTWCGSVVHTLTPSSMHAWSAVDVVLERHICAIIPGWRQHNKERERDWQASASTESLLRAIAAVRVVSCYVWWSPQAQQPVTYRRSWRLDCGSRRWAYCEKIVPCVVFFISRSQTIDTKSRPPTGVKLEKRSSVTFHMMHSHGLEREIWSRPEKQKKELCFFCKGHR